MGPRQRRLRAPPDHGSGGSRCAAVLEDVAWARIGCALRRTHTAGGLDGVPAVGLVAPGVRNWLDARPRRVLGRGMASTAARLACLRACGVCRRARRRRAAHESPARSEPRKGNDHGRKDRPDMIAAPNRIGAAVAVALHVTVLGALFTYAPTRSTLLSVAPIMVDWIAAPRPEPVVEAPKPRPVHRAIPRPIEKPSIKTAPAESPSPIVAPAPPPSPPEADAAGAPPPPAPPPPRFSTPP